MNINNNYSNCSHKQAFGASLTTGPDKLRTLASHMNFERAFENMTPDLAGHVELIPEGRFFNIHYKNGDIDLTKRTNLTEDIFEKDTLINPQQPYRLSASRVLAHLDDMVAKTGRKYGDENPVSKVFNRLMGLK